LMAYLCRCTD